MKYVICYDVADDKRRSRLVNVLLDYGARIQESVFYADLEGPLFAELQRKAERQLQAESDVLHIFPLCEACTGKKVVLGKGTIPETADYYIV